MDETLTCPRPRDANGVATVHLGDKISFKDRPGFWAAFDYNIEKDELLLAPWHEGWWYAWGPGAAVHCFTDKRALCMSTLVAQRGKLRSSKGGQLGGLCRTCVKMAERAGIPIPRPEWRPPT